MDFNEIIRETHWAILRCLARALCSESGVGKLQSVDHEGINREFAFLKSIRNARTNTFMTKQNLRAGYHSLFVGKTTETQKTATRISRIVSSFLADCLASRTHTKRAKAPDDVFSIRLNSPYSVLIKILTDPEAVETQEIVRFLTKIALMEKHGANINLSSARSDHVENEVTFSDLDQFYTTLEKYIQTRDARKPIGAAQRYLSELFAAYGMLSVRIELDPAKIPGANGLTNQTLREFEEYLAERSEYRRAEGLVALPSIAELANIAFGIPIAISGFNDLISGGLRQGAGEGTVTLLRGGAGSGKTTLSISIQRVVEALGIPTVFLSSEESRSALLARRQSVLNLSQKSHSRFLSESAPFTIIDTVSEKEDPSSSGSGITDLVQAVADRLEGKERGPNKAGQFARLFLVIDGIHNYILDEHKAEIRRLIAVCRQTNTHVLITSSDEWAHSQGVEYFVDNYFSLSTRVTRDPMPHVERGISILKTRHQSSLIGDHFMRFQDEGDLLFTPNFSELLKAHSRHVVLGPDRETYSKPFAVEVSSHSASQLNKRMLDLEHYDRSVTLVYGRGSASKTSLCLRLLASPNVQGKNSTKRILVVSFLSPDSYYQQKKRNFINRLGETLRASLARQQKISMDLVSSERLEESFPRWNDIEVETLSFTPGMITAEEVYSAVASRIANFDVGSVRFSGILFDGLHNVFVQFPLLEKHSELWSALVNLVRRVGIKTVATFTDFEVWGARTLTTVDYENVRAKPLLVALSQSIDYGFGLVPISQVGDSREKIDQGDLFRRSDPGHFVLSSFMAHSQASPTDYLIWDRTTETIRTTL